MDEENNKKKDPGRVGTPPPGAGTVPTENPGGEVRVLRVVEELDALLEATRLLTRTCERVGAHAQTHALQLGSELLLRRRNYLLNLSHLVGGSAAGYDSFPCDNCHITYPTVFLLNWLHRLLADIDGGGVADRRVLPASCSGLCDRTCPLRFGTSSRTDFLTEGALYPMGSPFSVGPGEGAPRVADDSSPRRTRFGELDEILFTRDALRSVSNIVRDGGGVEAGGRSADVELAYGASELLHSRRHFGFDMDCVENGQVGLYRWRLYDALASYEKRSLVDSYDGGTRPDP